MIYSGAGVWMLFIKAITKKREEQVDKERKVKLNDYLKFAKLIEWQHVLCAPKISIVPNRLNWNRNELANQKMQVSKRRGGDIVSYICV